MSPLLIKGLISVGGIGIGGVGAWQIHKLTRPSTIQEGIEREGRTFPGTGDNEDNDTWKNLYEANKSATSNKIGGIDDVTDENGKGQKMREKCRELMGKSFSDASAEEIGQVRDRCTKSSPQAGS